MKTWTLLAAAAIFASIPATGAARTLDPNVPEDALEISKRLQCGVKDGKLLGG